MIKILFVLFVSLMATSICAFELHPGVVSKGRDTVRNDVQKTASPIITSVIKANGGKPGRGLAYTNLGAGADWYRLYSKMVLVGVNTDTRSLIGRWPLNRWTHEVSDIEVASMYKVVGAQTEDAWNFYADNRSSNTGSLGCLANIPLRYGDIENDGKNELVMFLGRGKQQLDFLVFSPISEKIVFSSRVALQDFQEAPDLADVFYHSEASGPKAIIGKRTYAKLYFGDYDRNGSQDIVVWRKEYRSLTKAKSIEKGFELKHQIFRHYEFTGGEYLPQPTDSESIRSWLIANNLNWAGGFPSVSECVGQNGQLISELHDPLLNDPDVLKQ